MPRGPCQCYKGGECHLIRSTSCREGHQACIARDGSHATLAGSHSTAISGQVRDQLTPSSTPWHGMAWHGVVQRSTSLFEVCSNFCQQQRVGFRMTTRLTVIGQVALTDAMPRQL